MHYTCHEQKSDGKLKLIQDEPTFDHRFCSDRMGEPTSQKLMTIAWNTGPDQTVTLDGINYPFSAQSVIPLMVNQMFSFPQPARIVAWQFVGH